MALTDTCPPVELVAAFREAAPATTRALALVLAYKARGNPARLAQKYADKVAARVRVQAHAPPLVVVMDIDDTLIRDRATHSVLIPAIVQLHNKLVELGAAVYLVSARTNDAATRAWTVEQLVQLGIHGYKALHLAPDGRRKTMTDVSRWKMETRRGIGRAAGAPVVLTVGDQWSDMVTLSDDADIDTLDATFAPKQPWKIMRPNDGVSLWGLKLPSQPPA